MPTTTCPQCAAEVDAGAAFCSRCGGPLAGGATFAPPPDDAATSGSGGAGDHATLGPPPGDSGGEAGWGSAPPPYASGPTLGPPPAGPVQSDDRNLALLAHLSAFITFVGIPSFVGPLVVWLVKREQSAYVAAHAVEALKFNLSILIYLAAGFMLSLLTLGFGFLAFVPLAIIGGIVWFIFVILAATSASRGEFYRYPLTIRMVR